MILFSFNSLYEDPISKDSHIVDWGFNIWIFVCFVLFVCFWAWGSFFVIVFLFFSFFIFDYAPDQEWNPGHSSSSAESNHWTPKGFP